MAVKKKRPAPANLQGRPHEVYLWVESYEEHVIVDKTQVATMEAAGFVPVRRTYMPSRIEWRREVFPGRVLAFHLRTDNPITPASLVRLVMRQSFLNCEHALKNRVRLEWP